MTGICILFFIQVFLYVRHNGERAARVRTLLIAPFITLLFAIYFCLSADIVHSARMLLAAGISLTFGAFLEWIHVRSGQVIPDLSLRTLHLKESSRVILLTLMLLKSIANVTMVMPIFSIIPTIHTLFFSQFAPEMILFSLGSSCMATLLLSSSWKKAQQQYNHDDDTKLELLSISNKRAV